MNLRNTIKQIFVVISCFFITVFFVTKSAYAATTVNSNITSDTTWNAAGSPYNLTTNINVLMTNSIPTTLTIDASAGPVVVTFCNNCWLTINNGTTLDVNGTATNSVTFKHSSSTSVGAFDTVYIDSGATATISYAVFNYADSGLKCRGGSCSVDHSTFDTNRYGILVYDNSTLTTANNTFTRHTYFPIGIEPDNSSVSLGSGATADVLGSGATKNGYNAIGIGAGSNSVNNCNLDICTIPQRTFGGITNIPYLMWNYYFYGSNDTLQIDAGVVIKFANNNHLNIQSGARLDVNGTLGNEVVFTAEADDVNGGDTNTNGASTGAAGNWQYINLEGGTNTIDYAKILYADVGIRDVNLNTTLTINDSTLESNRVGISVYNKGSLVTARNTFNKQMYTPLEIEPENNGVTLGSGANADILGTSTNKNGYNALGFGYGNNGVNDCASDLCTIPVRSFANMSNAPYVVFAYYFDGSNDTLRIDAGVILKYVDNNHLNIRSGAKLDVNGTADNFVVMTTVHDDDATRGGDTNNNGTSTTPTAGNWQYVNLDSGSIHTIDFLKVLYADVGIRVVSLNTSLTINDSVLQSNRVGISVYNNASITTARNTFNKQVYTPLEIEPENNGATLGTGANADILGTSTNKNSYNALGFGYGNNGASACISDLCTIPVRSFANMSNAPYVVFAYYFDGSNDTLRIDENVVLKFIINNHLNIRSGAKIDVNGTLGNNVYFTSERDDSIGGDTNNDSNITTPYTGSWQHVNMESTGAHTIDFATFRYANNAIYFNGSNITVNDSTVSNSTTGLYLNNTTSPTLNRVNIENNGSYSSGEYRWGAYNNTGTAMSLPNLYWGSASGPNDADNAGSCTTNAGSGNAVRDTASNAIDYCPFSTTRFNSTAGLSQYRADGTTAISVGGSATDVSAVLKANVVGFSSTGTLTVEYEIQPTNTTFTNSSTHTDTVSFLGSSVTSDVTVTGLVNSTAYHWQARVCNDSSDCSTWTSFGSNDESAADFQVVFNNAPTAPSSLGPSGVVNGSYSTSRTPTFTFSLADSDVTDTVKYRIQIDDSADFGSAVVDYTSALAAQGSFSFSVSQAAGTGSYAIGSEGQTLSDGSYYWKVQTLDNAGSTSSYTSANLGAVAFIVDGTAPTIPGTPSTTTPTTDTTPTWSWTASTDAGSGLAGSSYTIQWCTSTDFSSCGANTATSSTASYTHVVALAEGVWYVRVHTEDVLGNVSANSDNGTVRIDTQDPATNASTVVMKKNVDAAETMTSNQWTNDLSPFFSWQVATDNTGGSGIKGYCLYLGTDSAGDPESSKGLLGVSPVSTTGSTCQFITSDLSVDFATTSLRGTPWISSSTSSYYLNIRAIDNANNVFPGSVAQFRFRFDNTTPTNVGRIYVSSDSYSSVADMSFGWPAVSSQEGSSDAHSEQLGWQYQINSTSGTWLGTTTHPTLGVQYIPLAYSQPLYLTQDRDGASIVVGSNIVYFRTIDNTGNVSTGSVTGILSYGGSAPSFTTSCNVTNGVVVNPGTSTSNAFSLSWEEASPSAGRTIESYYYMVNTTPPSTLSTITGNVSTYIATAGRSVASGSLTGAIKGSNTVYVVAKDDLDNYSSSNCLKGVFTLNSTLPDPPKNLTVSDASVKSASLWRGSLAWQEPVYKGTGTLTYTVQRSSDNATWTTIATTSGTAYVDTVSSSQAYYWRVGTSDTSSDSQNAPSFATSVTLIPKGKYTEPADLSSGPTVSGLTTKRATVSWGTGRKSDSKVRYGLSSGSYFTEESSVSDQVTDHSIKLTNLSPGTTYYYKVKWTDEDGNTGTSDEKTFTTDAAPSVQDVSAKNIGLTNALIQFTSKGSQKAKIYYGKTTNFGGIKEVTTATSTTTNTTELTDLDDGTKYYYRIDGVDSEGDTYAGTILDFTTLPRPKVSNIRLQEVANTAQTTILVTWEANTDISSILTYYPEGKPELSRNEVNVELLSGDHSMLIKGLLPDTRYVLFVKGQDKVGNEAVSDGQTFVTSMDTRPASILNLKIIGGTIPPVGFAAGEIRAQLIVTWDTDEPATSQIEYGEGTNNTYGQKTQEDGNFTTNHTVILSNLVPSQVYHLRGVSKDAAGNTSLSVDSITIAPKATKSALDLVVGNLSDVFGVLKGVKLQ